MKCTFQKLYLISKENLEIWPKNLYHPMKPCVFIQYRLGTVNSNTVNSKLTLNSNFLKTVFSKLPLFSMKRNTVSSNSLNSKQNLANK